MKPAKEIIKLLILFLIPLTVAYIFWYLRNEKEKPFCKDCNIIIVSLDTLGAEHLPCYGYNRNTAPTLCSFAENNILFQNAYSNSWWTLPAATTTFTGLYPENHRVIERKDVLTEEKLFLPEVLQKNGYKTIAVLPNDDPSLPKKTVFNRGIDQYIPEPSPWTEIMTEFEKSTKDGKKTFLYLHDYSVHAPYLLDDYEQLYKTKVVAEIPTKRDEIFSDISNSFLDYIEKEIPLGIDKGDIEKEKFKDLMEYFNGNKNYDKKREYYKKFYEENASLNWYFLYEFNWKRKINTENKDHIEYIKALYDQQINIMDETKLKYFFQFLIENGFNKNTIVVITSEHGEEFAEHGKITHLTLYNPNIRIPFILSVPGFSGKKINQPVQLADLTPTILDLVGIRTEANFDGISLIPATQDQAINDRVLVVEGRDVYRKVIIWNHWKLFLNNDLEYLELYNLTDDKGEAKNVLFENLDVAENIKNKYKAMIGESN